MMNERFHPGPHPDADQLNAFVEGALNKRERQEALTHLAECSECRRVVLLAQEPLLPAPVSTETAPFWRRWLGPLSLAGGALACGLLVAVSLHLHHTSAPAHPAEIAKEAPQPVPPAIASNTQEPAGSPVPLKPPSRHAVSPAEAAPTSSSTQSSSAVAKADRQISGGVFAASGLSLSAPAAPPVSQPAAAGMAGGFGSAAGAVRPSASASANTVDNLQQSRALPSVSAGMGTAQSTAQQSVTAAAAAPSSIGVNANSIEQLPMNGRNTNGSVSKKNSLAITAAGKEPVTLTIEHNRDTIDGLSEITGSVTDPSGAVVPGAMITLRQLAGTASGKATTGADGRFTVAALPAGRYALQIASPGFGLLSQQLELQPRDLATLRSTLQPGSATESVSVSNMTAQMATAEGSVNGTLLPRRVDALPSKLPETVTVQSRKRLLAVDSAGTLFSSRNGGKRWKAVKPQWAGRIAQLSLASSSAAVIGKSVFQLTTDQGAVWLSDDGTHWHLR